MRGIWTRYYLDTRDLRFDLAEKWLEMHRLFTDPKTDAPALMAKEKELMAIRDRLMTGRVQTMVDCRSVLTPEQIRKLDLMVMSHGERGMDPGMMEGGMGHPGW